jgi:hemoglobin/transferrin/lactoferrin receptor protein
MQRKNIGKYLLTVAVANLPNVSFAAEVGIEKESNIDVIVIKGNRINDAIDNGTILAIAPQNLADVLLVSPEITIGGATPSAQRFYVRGLEGTSLATRFDGVPASNNNLFQHRGAIPLIDPLLIDSVVVKTAPVAARDGSGALGGAINIRSIDLNNLVSADDNTLINGNLNFSSVSDSLGGGITVAHHVNDHVSFVGFGSYRDTENYEDGNGEIVDLTAIKTLSGYSKVQMKPTAEHQFDVSLRYSKNEGLLPYGAGDFPTQFFLDRYDVGRAGGGPVNQTLEQLTLSTRYKGFSSGSPDAVLYYSDSALTNNETGAIFSQIQYGGRAISYFDISSGEMDIDLVVGIDSLLEVTKTEFEADSTSIFESDAAQNDSTTIGMFSDANMQLGSLSIDMGLRVDYLSFEFGDHDFDSVKASPSLRLTYSISPSLSLYGGMGIAYRATNTLPANRSDRFSEMTLFPKRGIKPEKSVQKAIGANYTLTNVLSYSGQFEASIEAFEVNLQDVIIFEGGNSGADFSAISNTEGSYTSRGVTATIGWYSEMVTSTLSFNTIKLDDPSGEPISEIRNIAAAHGDKLVWDSKFEITPTLSGGYTLTLFDDLDRLPSGSEKKEGYITHKIRLDWRLSKKSPYLLALVVRNLTDEYYVDHSSFAVSGYSTTPEAGRDIRAEIRATF